MICPKCSFTVKKNGVNRSGTQRYYCQQCAKSFTDSVLKQGRPTIKEKAMTAAERQQRKRNLDRLK